MGIKQAKHQIHRLKLHDGREVVIAPIIGHDGVLLEFIALEGHIDPLPIERPESETYLKVG